MTFFANVLRSLDQHRGQQNSWHITDAQADVRRMPDTAPILDIRDLNFHYTNTADRTPVLHTVNLQIKTGDCLALIGPNGGGKTTLLKLIAGLLKPTSGTITVCGQNAAPSKGHIGYVPQQIEVNRGFPISAIEAVLTGTLSPRKGLNWFRTRPPSQEVAFAEAIMEKLGIQDVRHARMDSLSGGQRQRVLIGRALMASPGILLFDEPTSNIDPEGRYCFHELMAELSGSITMIVVSHDLSILSSGVNCLAGVNRHLALTRGNRPDQKILSLIYGQHSADCPMDNYLRNLQDFAAFNTKAAENGGCDHA